MLTLAPWCESIDAERSVGELLHAASKPRFMISEAMPRVERRVTLVREQQIDVHERSSESSGPPSEFSELRSEFREFLRHFSELLLVVGELLPIVGELLLIVGELLLLVSELLLLVSELRAVVKRPSPRFRRSLHSDSDQHSRLPTLR
jgi:hypothetical protein